MDRTVKVLYLTLSGSKVGGAEIQYRYLIEGLKGSRYSPIVICPNHGDLAEDLISADIPTYIMNLPMWRKAKSIFTRYIAAAKLIKLAKEIGVGLIHSEFRMNHYLISVSRKLGIPCVSHLRGPVRPDQVMKYRFKDVSVIITISERYKEMLIQNGVSPEKVTVIYDSVDLNRFRISQPRINVLKRDFSPEGEVLIGIVGRIEPFKRQLDFLKAVEIVLKERKNTSFFIIGGVQSKSYFERMRSFITDRGLDRYVIFTGTREDMPEVMASLDILVTLSGGSVTLEAMACGKPVISARKEEPLDPSWQIVRDGKTGIVTPHDDIPALAEAMIQLIDDPNLRRRLGREGRRWVEKRFSHRQMVLKTLTVYNNLI